MKPSQFTFALAVILAFVIGNTLAVSDEEPAGPMTPEQMEEMMKLITPGPEHEKLGEMVGVWDVTMKMVMPGGPAMEPQKGMSTISWAIEGRWLKEHMTGFSFMGRPYEGFGVSGYDNMTKNWVSTWCSSMDTQLMTMRGVKVDPDDKVFTQYGTMNEWMDGTFNKPIKVQTTHKDKDCFVVEIWDMQIGPNGAAVIEYTYNRRKD